MAARQPSVPKRIVVTGRPMVAALRLPSSPHRGPLRAWPPSAAAIPGPRARVARPLTRSIRENGSGSSWWSQRRWSRSAGLARTATGTMGSPAWRATISTPGFATRYGPHGPSGRHDHRVSVGAELSQLAGQAPPRGRFSLRGETEDHHLARTAGEGLEDRLDDRSPRGVGRERGMAQVAAAGRRDGIQAEVVLVPEREDDLVTGDRTDTGGAGDDPQVPRQEPAPEPGSRGSGRRSPPRSRRGWA